MSSNTEQGFKDHFSGQSAIYARYRPSYPAELFRYLAEATPRRERCWDCATGSGQATAGLAEHFDQVIASDPSLAQLQHAPQHPRVHYLADRAEASALASHSVDLITVAQALHWFDHDAFYREVYRVLRQDGLFATWTYTLVDVDGPIGDLVRWYYRDVVGAYWPPERRWVDDHYSSLPFPFTPLSVPEIYLELAWSLEDLLGYLDSWSATQRYRQQRDDDPLAEIRGRLVLIWGEKNTRRTMRWRVYLRAGHL